MSALAARRAALSAGISSGNPIVVETAVATAVVRASSPSLSSLDDSGSEAGPSKRRKITKKTARYFAPEEPEDDKLTVTKRKKDNKRNRRFSPSAPAPESDSDKVDEVDSSDKEVSSVAYSGESESDDSESDSGSESEVSLGELRHRNRVNQWKDRESRHTGSRFKSVSGVNFQHLSSHALTDCGVTGIGDGVVLSLVKQDVSRIGDPQVFVWC